MTTTVATPDLRPIDLFDDLDDALLAEWAALARPQRADAGTVIVEQGAQSPGLILLFEGTIQTALVDGAGFEPTGRHHAPTWLAAIGVLTRQPLPVRMTAETDCSLAIVAPDDFRALVFAQPVVHDRVLAQVTPVLSRVTALEQNRERLASLGTMAAGLAHELNNPAAAARRAASQLGEALDTLNGTFRRFVESGIDEREAGALLSLVEEAKACRAGRTALDTLDEADAEDTLLDWLDQRDVPEAWTLVEPLAAAGLDAAWLERVAAAAGPSLPGVLRWIAATLTADTLVDELRESTDRMSSLVGAVKTYAYMDRGTLVEVDLHEGLETTLVVLGHKLKKTAIEVVRDYDRSLPKVTARGSELNQVWTNLLDNAIDALGDSGELRITTKAEGDCVVVEIADDGPGIPAELLERIFDAFVTTKDVGSGTGLGLSTARMIVVDRHDGSLTVDSQPGRTVFQVSLPTKGGKP